MCVWSLWWAQPESLIRRGGWETGLEDPPTPELQRIPGPTQDIS